jgi:hypothetical protein
MRREQRLPAAARERRGTGEHLIGDEAKSVQVGSMIDRRLPGCLFRGHVERGS